MWYWRNRTVAAVSPAAGRANGPFREDRYCMQHGHINIMIAVKTYSLSRMLNENYHEAVRRARIGFQKSLSQARSISWQTETGAEQQNLPCSVIESRRFQIRGGALRSQYFRRGDEYQNL